MNIFNNSTYLCRQSSSGVRYFYAALSRSKHHPDQNELHRESEDENLKDNETECMCWKRRNRTPSPTRAETPSYERDMISLFEDSWLARLTLLMRREIPIMIYNETVTESPKKMVGRTDLKRRDPEAGSHESAMLQHWLSEGSLVNKLTNEIQPSRVRGDHGCDLPGGMFGSCFTRQSQALPKDISYDLE